MANRKKNVAISFRTTEEDSEVIHALADEAGLTLSEYLLSVALGKEIVKMPDIRNLVRELKAQGNNLNRLTVLSNQGRINVVNLNETLEMYWKLQSVLKEFFDGRRNK